MPEPPDFDQIALGIVTAVEARFWTQRVGPTSCTDGQSKARSQVEVVDLLRQVWNARGAADLDAMETAHANYDWSELENALRSLDR